jgi:hypothetical protein
MNDDDSIDVFAVDHLIHSDRTIDAFFIKATFVSHMRYLTCLFDFDRLIRLVSNNRA